MKIFIPTLALTCIMLLASCCNNNKRTEEKDNETLYQISSIKSLFEGGYDGTITVAELRSHGDCGIGTFDKINGEMVVLNDTVYQCLYDGTVQIANDTTTVPFADITYIDSDIRFVTSKAKSMDSLSTMLNLETTIHGYSPNDIFIASATGRFSYIQVRSELPQKKPYKALYEVMKTNQMLYEYKYIDGTLIALYTPSCMDKITGTGWHYHFISADRKKGGHVLSLSADELNTVVDHTPLFLMEKRSKELKK